MSAHVKVTYRGRVEQVRLDPFSTVGRLRMWSVFEHSLPTTRHEEFKLFNADGQELDPEHLVEDAGVKADDALELKYAPAGAFDLPDDSSPEGTS